MLLFSQLHVLLALLVDISCVTALPAGDNELLLLKSPQFLTYSPGIAHDSGHTGIEEDDNSDNECPVCFEDLSEGDVYTIECNHLIHTRCARQWYIKSGEHRCLRCQKIYTPNYYVSIEQEIQMTIDEFFKKMDDAFETYQLVVQIHKCVAPEIGAATESILKTTLSWIKSSGFSSAEYAKFDSASLSTIQKLKNVERAEGHAERTLQQLRNNPSATSWLCGLIPDIHTRLIKAIEVLIGKVKVAALAIRSDESYKKRESNESKN